MIRKIYNVDPLLCPSCGANMKIIAFITHHPTVARILEHIHMPCPDATICHPSRVRLVLSTHDVYTS